MELGGMALNARDNEEKHLSLQVASRNSETKPSFHHWKHLHLATACALCLVFQRQWRKVSQEQWKCNIKQRHDGLPCVNSQPQQLPRVAVDVILTDNGHATSYKCRWLCAWCEFPSYLAIASVSTDLQEQWVLMNSCLMVKLLLEGSGAKPPPSSFPVL